jgi:predicted HTH domain antitoxin
LPFAHPTFNYNHPLSKIAGMEIMEFQKLLANWGICVHYDVEDLEQDVQHLRDRG